MVFSFSAQEVLSGGEPLDLAKLSCAVSTCGVREHIPVPFGITYNPENKVDKAQRCGCRAGSVGGCEGAAKTLPEYRRGRALLQMREVLTL